MCRIQCAGGENLIVSSSSNSSNSKSKLNSNTVTLYIKRKKGVVVVVTIVFYLGVYTASILYVSVYRYLFCGPTTLINKNTIYGIRLFRFIKIASSWLADSDRSTMICQREIISGITSAAKKKIDCETERKKKKTRKRARIYIYIQVQCKIRKRLYR